jgi:hypothetical protein
MTTPTQRRIESLEATAYREERRHEEILSELAELKELTREHHRYIADLFNDQASARTDIVAIRGQLHRMETTLTAIAAHMGIQPATAPEGEPK